MAGAGAYDGSSVIYAGGTQKGGEPTDTVWALREGRWREIGHLAHIHARDTSFALVSRAPIAKLEA